MTRQAGDTVATSAGKEADSSEVTAAIRRPRHRWAQVFSRAHADASDSVFDRLAASEAAPPDADKIETDESTTTKPATPGLRFGLVFVLIVIAAVASVGGWISFHAYGSLQVQRHHARLLAAGEDAAVKLTTISYADADADVKRILDSATGQFSDDFRSRSQPFVNMVKQVQSTTVGTVAQAGLESVEGDKARVLVAVSVKTTLGAGGGEQPTHVWRMRIDVQQVGNETKVSNVEFVP